MGLTQMQTVLTSSVNEGSMTLMIYPDSLPGQHSLYPGGQHTVAFYSVCVPMGSDVSVSICNHFVSDSANKCSDPRTGDLGVLTTHDTSPWFSPGDAGSTSPG